MSKAAKSSCVATRQSKRKSDNAGQWANIKNNKKTKIDNAPTLEQALQCPSLLQGDHLLKSPCQSAQSFDLDANLDFNSDNFLWSTQDVSPQNQNLSFLPVKSKDIDEMMLNNPAFNSAAARPPTNATQQHLYAATSGYYSGHYPYGGRNAYYGDWRSGAPSIPSLGSNNAKSVTVDEFSKRLKDVEKSLMADVQLGEVTDQVLKLHLWQKWAKNIAQRPVQLQNESTLETNAASKATASAHAGTQGGTNADATTQVKIKMETPGTPGITP